jgi:two-component system NarL family sensor kinase
LLLALRRLAESAADRGRLALDLSLPERIPSLSPDAEQCFYRVAQESLENVVHHAQAKKLAVCLEVSPGEIVLRIEDDGLGFDSQQARAAGHYGLSGMYERAQLVGASLAIDSHPSGGTRLRLGLEGY